MSTGRRSGGKSGSGEQGRKAGLARPKKGGAGAAKKSRAKKPRRPGSKAPGPVVIAVFVVAALLLTALIWWGTYRTGGKPAPEAPPKASPQARQPSVPEKPEAAPSQSGLSDKPDGRAGPDGGADSVPKQGAAGSAPTPLIEPKPQFSSRDLPPDPAGANGGGSKTGALALNRPGIPAPHPAVPPVAGPQLPARVAIVIDDLGEDLAFAKKLAGLPFPVTFSILPNCSHSAEIAALAHSSGHEVMLHFPMEPLAYPRENPGKGALMVAMKEDAIRRTVRAALDGSPYFSGVNNHMGSRFTENADLMKIVMDEVKQRGLFFVDSETSPRSKAYSVARQMGAPALKRDIFLDHDPAIDSVRSQMARLVLKAKAEGCAVAIGHPRETTLKVLAEASEMLRKEGVTVVPCGELARAQR